MCFGIFNKYNGESGGVGKSLFISNVAGIDTVDIREYGLEVDLIFLYVTRVELLSTARNDEDVDMLTCGCWLLMSFSSAFILTGGGEGYLTPRRFDHLLKVCLQCIATFVVSQYLNRCLDKGLNSY